MKDEISMPELLPLILESVQGLQNQFNEFRSDFSDFKNEVNQRFDKIDQTLNYHETRLSNIDNRLDGMVDKNDFRSLVKILERKEIISKYESAHVLNTIKTTP